MQTSSCTVFNCCGSSDIGGRCSREILFAPLHSASNPARFTWRDALTEVLIAMEENDRSVYFSIQSRSCYPHVQTYPCRNPSGLFCRDVSFDVDYFDANGLATHDVYEKGFHFLLKHKQRTVVVRSQLCKTNLCASTYHAV